MQASRQDVSAFKKSDYCDVCGLGSHTSRIRQFRRIDEYSGSAQHGCRACLAIHKFLSKQHHRQGSSSFIIAYKPIRIYESAGRQVYEFFSLSHAFKAKLERRSSCDRIPEQHPSIRRMSEPRGCTSSVQCFDILRHWISRCQDEHRICNSITPNELPHRVLEILCIQPLRVRVVEGGTRRRKYACLSHRWGPKTKSTSLNTHL